ncbi:Protein KRI1-like protein [Aphelenchoides bicaudatus]|nr:Protein KRI1-like protein [Aphelenchoides bicaudatus]
MSRQKLDLDLDEDDAALTINKDYARNYGEWRKKEELQKFKDKYGTDNLDELEDDDSDSVSSVESVKWTADNERDFLRTLGALKSKDPKIYRDDVRFFHETEEEPTSSDSATKKKQKKEKPMTLRDYEQKLVIERGGQLSDDEEPEKNAGPSYSEREAQLKQDLKDALNDFSGNESDEEDGLLKKRVKTVEETKQEDDEYYEWLKGHRQDAAGVDEDLKNLKKNWQKPELDDGERFLRDYILNKQYETDANPSAIGDEYCPTYDEIVEQDDEEEKRAEFEHKYNFRYEEPDQDFIKQFPRTVAESLRRQDTRRKDARDRRKQRKDEEKQEREEEIRQIRQIKKAEGEKKLRKLKQMAGDDMDVPFDLNELEKDFDPEEHDRMMKRLEEETDELPAEVEESDEKPSNKSNNKSNASTSNDSPQKKKQKKDAEFRYRQVEPQNYGLSTDEILDLDDRQLNAWVSIKKVTGYKSQRDEHTDQMVYNQKSRNVDQKRKILSSVAPKIPKTKKAEQKTPVNEQATETTNGKKRRHRKRKTNLDLDADRLRSYGVSTQKLKSVLHKKKKQNNSK